MNIYVLARSHHKREATISQLRPEVIAKVIRIHHQPCIRGQAVEHVQQQRPLGVSRTSAVPCERQTAAEVLA